MVKRTAIQPNLLDRAIAYVAPQVAARRMGARAAMSMAASGGYSGGQYSDRLAHWQPGGGDADSNIVTDLRELRNRSRDLARNNPIASGAIETQCTHIVGTGLAMQPHVDAEYLGLDEDAAEEWQDAVQREWLLWCESVFADYYEQQTFYELQELALRSALEGGDCGVVLTAADRAGFPYRLALQVIEAERISNPEFKTDTAGMVQGVEKDATGRPVAVHISDRHPQQWGAVKGTKWTRVPLRGESGRVNFVHLFRKKRPGQTRGVPELAPIIEPLKQLGRYTDAELSAAVVSASFAVFVKMNPDAFQDLFDDDAQRAVVNNAKRWDGTLQPGAAVNLLPGEEIQTAESGRPNPNFDPFVAGVLKQVGMGLGIPYEVITKHFQSSYSAARAALLDAWRTFKIRREWLASKLCQVVYEEWLAEAVASGRVQAAGFFADAAVRKAWSRATWVGDGPGAIDPEKEARAARERMDIGMTTLAEEIMAYDGGSWEAKHRQQVRERHEREEGGLVAPVTQPMPGAAAMPGAEPPEPPEQEAEEPEDDNSESED